MSTVRSKQAESRLMETLEQMFPNQIFTASDLKTPTQDFVLSFYLDFLSNIGVKTDALCQIPPSIAELFGETYVIRKISVVLRDVFSKIMFDEIPQFGMMDLLQPTPGRTAAFFTGMSNFLCYAINKLEVVDDYIATLEEQKKEIDTLQQEKEVLRQKLNEEANTRALISDLQAKVENKQQELRSLSEEVNHGDKIMVEKEKTVEDMESKLQTVTKDLAEAQEEMAKTEALIVRSPLSVKNQKCQLEQKLIEVEEETNAAKDMLTNKREISKNLETLGEDLNVMIGVLEKFISESKETSNEKLRTEELRKKLLKAREEEEDINMERQKLHERGALLQETESGLLLRNETKRKEIQGKIKELKRELDDILRGKTEGKKSLQSAIGKRREEISRFENLHASMCKKYEEFYAALLLKEKSVRDKAQQELDENLSKFQRYM